MHIGYVFREWESASLSGQVDCLHPSGLNFQLNFLLSYFCASTNTFSTLSLVFIFLCHLILCPISVFSVVQSVSHSFLICLLLFIQSPYMLTKFTYFLLPFYSFLQIFALQIQWPIFSQAGVRKKFLFFCVYLSLVSLIKAFC